jgi:predicted extracellular nuclease
VATLGLLAALVPITSATAATGDPALINEILASHSGTDNTEFVELYGTPGYSLEGLSLIVVEGDAFDPGRIDRRFDFKPFHEIGPNGFFLFGNCGGLDENYSAVPDASLSNNYFENSSFTVALIETESLTGAVGDLVSGSEIARSALGLSDGDSGDQFFFDAPVLGPDGTFFPAGGRRLQDGVDTGSAADWEFADFFLPGANTPTGGGFDGCSPIPLTIPEIQGEGRTSVYAGEAVETTGIVTAVARDDRNFWIQDPAGDGDPATSDGLYVFRGGPGISVGDEVTVIGSVSEFVPSGSPNSLPVTEIAFPASVTVESGANPLPSPVPLLDLPDEGIPEGEAFWEPLEGMLVAASNAPVVAPTTRFGEFGMLAKNDAKPGSGFFPQVQQILLRSLGAEAVDYNPERIVVDDSTLEEAIQVMPGDRVRSLVGVVDYTFGMYKLQPTSFDVKTHRLPAMPVSKRSGPDGDLTITTYNVENLFDLIDNPDKDDEGSTPTPEELEVQLTKLAASIETELELPEIMVLQEVENTEIAQDLGDRVNEAAGTGYVATSFETSDARGIEVAFLWDGDRVELLDAFQLPGEKVEDAFGPTSPSPGREPLYGKFRVDGEVVHIVGNHFKSKGGDDPLYGVNWPPIRVTEAQRKAQAEAVREFVDVLLDGDPDAMVMVAGDLNDFSFSEPGEGPDNPVAILQGIDGGIPLLNLVDLEKPAEQFTFIFDANSQVLDHMLVTPELYGRVVAADLLHFNASFPDAFGADPTTTVRASDHDPVEGRFSLR